MYTWVVLYLTMGDRIMKEEANINVGVHLNTSFEDFHI